ncbi:MAG: type II toxin-antitoxin system RelE/ParE family toxin [Tepidisphaeraceae bacterium]|jgi:mRNA interferase RelE/StbE
MSYGIHFRESVRRDMRKMERQVLRRLDAAIARLADNPRPHGVLKIQGRDHTYRIVVGPYRVVYEVDDDARTVTLWHVADRKDVYRGM